VPLLTFTGDIGRGGLTRVVDTWVELNQCDPEPVVEDLGSGVARKTYQNCLGDIVFYDVDGMGHVFPLHEAIGPGANSAAVYEEVDYLDEAIAFFDSHPLE
jgi:poly(3-hydroxybutyrate) depolymerase